MVKLLNRGNGIIYRFRQELSCIICVVLLLNNGFAWAQKDTLRVMAYNVLNYGEYPLCQGPNSLYHAYMDTIVQYTNPDVISLEKMGSIKTGPSDFSYSAAISFGDSILAYALNAAFPGRYAYCPFTNTAASSDMSMLFYDQRKLGFCSIVCSYVNITDFNTYKLYYKDPNLATTHDTTFIYFTVNHDQSGSSSDAVRGAQITGEMAQIKTHFKHLANHVNMGDFNTRSTLETCYQALVAPSDTNYRFYDPPFTPDNKFSYPANYDASPNTYTAYLTTSTRSSGTIPNSCGTSGGAKGWYDHIFISPWILNNTNYIKYIPNSYRTIGNDGHRLSVSVNSSTPVVNTAAPASVLNSLFQMSNKYPVMVDLEVSYNTTGTGPDDPELALGLHEVQQPEEKIVVVNPVGDDINIYCAAGLIGTKVRIACFDMFGRLLLDENVLINSSQIRLPFTYSAGIYMIRISDANRVLYIGKIRKD